MGSVPLSQAGAICDSTAGSPPPATKWRDTPRARSSQSAYALELFRSQRCGAQARTKVVPGAVKATRPVSARKPGEKFLSEFLPPGGRPHPPPRSTPPALPGGGWLARAQSNLTGYQSPLAARTLRWQSDTPSAVSEDDRAIVSRGTEAIYRAIRSHAGYGF